MSGSTFYEIMEVSSGAEPEEIQEHARENIDEFKIQIEEAEDSTAERRRILLAFEVLTDPEERYLYELFGHEEYVAQRLDGNELKNIESLGNQNLTAAFSSDTDRTDTEIFDPSAETSDTQVFGGGDSMDATVAGVCTDAEPDSDDTPDSSEPVEQDDSEANHSANLDESVGKADDVVSKKVESSSTQSADLPGTETKIKESDGTNSEGAHVSDATTTIGDDATNEDSELESPEQPLAVDSDSDLEPSEAASAAEDAETDIDDDAASETAADDTDETEGDVMSNADSLEEVSKAPTLVDRLSEFPLSQSPLSEIPGIRSEQYRAPSAAGYGLLGFGVIFLAGSLLPYGSTEFGLVIAFGLSVGAVATYVAGALRFQREILYRTGVGVAVCLPLLAAVTLGFETETATSVLFAGALTAGLVGVSGSNTYIELTRQNMREHLKGDESRGGRNYVETDPTFGTDDKTIAADAALEQFAESQSGRTGAVADDLTEEATVHATRHFIPERHIRRRLLVKDERTSREAPTSDFPDIESKLRHDVDQRDQNHPEGFAEETHKYLIPRSVNERTCPACSGATRVTCSSCAGHGEVTCPRCNGKCHNICSTCNGSGRVESGNGYQRCYNCSGQGHNPCNRCSATGTVVCGSCNGSGEVTCGRCEGDGQVVQYTTLTRKYTPETEVDYENESIPIDKLTDADGTQVKRERELNRSPHAEEGDVFMREHEVHEIPTDIVTYEYAGDLWEAYDIEETIKVPAYPRELGQRVKYLAVANVVSCGLLIYVGVVGPAGLP